MFLLSIIYLFIFDETVIPIIDLHACPSLAGGIHASQLSTISLTFNVNYLYLFSNKVK